jgi:hypothetical protein
LCQHKLARGQRRNAHRFEDFTALGCHRPAALFCTTLKKIALQGARILRGVRKNKRGLRQPEVAPGLYAGDGLLMFWSHEPIAPWQTEAWLVEMRRSLRPNAYLRMIENRFVSTESTFIDMSRWDACVIPGATPALADRSLPVWFGFGASVKRDSSAIVVCTFDKGATSSSCPASDLPALA